MQIMVWGGTILDTKDIKRVMADPEGESYVVDSNDKVHPCEFLVAAAAVEAFASAI